MLYLLLLYYDHSVKWSLSPIDTIYDNFFLDPFMMHSLFHSLIIQAASPSSSPLIFPFLPRLPSNIHIYISCLSLPPFPAFHPPLIGFPTPMLHSKMRWDKWMKHLSVSSRSLTVSSLDLFCKFLIRFPVILLAGCPTSHMYRMSPIQLNPLLPLFFPVNCSSSLTLSSFPLPLLPFPLVPRPCCYTHPSPLAAAHSFLIKHLTTTLQLKYIPCADVVTIS